MAITKIDKKNNSIITRIN